MRYTIAVAIIVLTYTMMYRNGLVYEDLTPTGAVSLTELQSPSRALAHLSFLAMSPRRQHAMSLLLHVTAALLLGLFAARMGLHGPWTMLVFGVHPLASEAVLYGAQRNELLSAIGILLACLSVTSKRNWLLVIGVFVGSVLAMLGKESGVSVLLLVPLVAFYVSCNVWALILPVSWLLYFASSRWSSFVELVLHGDVRNTMSWPSWFLLQASGFWHMVRLSVWPVGLSVEPTYTRTTAWLQEVSGISVICACAFWRDLYRRYPMVAFGFAWCVLSVGLRFLTRITLAPLSEHLFYVPLAGLVMAFMSVCGGQPCEE